MNIVDRIRSIYGYRDDISAVIRSKGVVVPEGTKLRELPPYINMLEYRDAPSPEEGWSEEYVSSIMDEALSDLIVERSRWNGHVDVEGLREIGWTEDDIQYFQDNGVDWNEEDDELYLVSDYEKELYRTNAITTTNYTSTNIANNADFVVEWRNNVRWMPKWTNTKLNNNITFKNFSKMIGCPCFDHTNQFQCGGMFLHCYELRCIPPLTFKANTLWDGTSMFFGCKKIKTIPDTINWEYAKSMNTMFRYCHDLMYLPPLNIKNASSGTYSFSECFNLKVVTLTNSSKLTNLTGMFEYCKHLKTVSLFDTSNVTVMQNMFLDCESLENIPNFNVEKNTNFISTFKYCFKLKDVPNMNFASTITSYNSMCYSCYSIKNVPTTLNFTSTNDINSMFENCINIEEFPYKLNLNSASTSATEGIKSFSYVFRNTKIKELQIGLYFKSGGDTYIANGVPTLKKISVDDFNGSTYAFGGSDMTFVEEIGGELKGLRNSIAFNGFYTLDRENMLKIINALEDVTGASTSPKLTFGTDKLRNLTAEDKLIATNKGWVLA